MFIHIGTVSTGHFPLQENLRPDPKWNQDQSPTPSEDETIKNRTFHDGYCDSLKELAGSSASGFPTLQAMDDQGQSATAMLRWRISARLAGPYIK